jgi:vacuolar-type H+-ATPase subunit H
MPELTPRTPNAQGGWSTGGVRVLHVALTQINVAAAAEAHVCQSRLPGLPLDHEPGMVTARRTATSDAAVEAAIADVLAAERAAHEAVAQARVEATAIADAARARARVIAQRADRRMQRVRAAYAAATQASVAEIAARATYVEQHGVGATEDSSELAAAVTRLAAKLTGGS